MLADITAICTACAVASAMSLVFYINALHRRLSCDAAATGAGLAEQGVCDSGRPGHVFHAAFTGATLICISVITF